MMKLARILALMYALIANVLRMPHKTVSVLCCFFITLILSSEPYYFVSSVSDGPRQRGSFPSIRLRKMRGSYFFGEHCQIPSAVIYGK